MLQKDEMQSWINYTDNAKYVTLTSENKLHNEYNRLFAKPGQVENCQQ